MFLLFLAGAGAALRLAHLTSKPYWFDECISVVLARLDWSNFLHILWWREANMTLYYLLLRGWLHFGRSEFFVRSLSVLMSAATIPAVFWLASLLYNRRIAFIASALFTVNAYSVRYAQETRGYALFVLLATLCSASLVAYTRQPTRRNRVGYIVLAVLAVYAHFYALLLVAAHWLALRCDPYRSSDPAGSWHSRSWQLRRSWRVIGIAVSPLLIFVAKTGAGPIRWITRPSPYDVLKFFEHLAGADSWPLLALYVVACVAAVAPIGAKLWRRDQTWEAWRAQCLLIWLLFPVMLTILLSFVRPVFLGRYLIFCLPALVILAAAGLASLRPWGLLPAVAIVVVFSVHGVLFIYSHDFDAERDGSGAATNLILNHSQTGDGVIFHIAEARAPYEFYRSLRSGGNTGNLRFSSQLGPEILFPHTGAGLGYRDFKAKLTPELLGMIVANHSRVWVFLIYNGDGHPDATTRLLTQTLSSRFSHMQDWQFPKVELRLYGGEEARFVGSESQ